MTVSERLLAALQSAWSYFAALSPLLLIVNVLLSLALVAVYWAGSRAIAWALRFGARHIPVPATAEKKVRTTRAMRFSGLVLRLLLALAVLVGILSVWGADVLAWLSRGVGQQAVELVVRLGVLIIFAVIALEISALLVNHGLDRLKVDAQPRRIKQLDTLGPIIRNGVQIAIGLMVFLTLFSQIGVQVGPLLAGAGVAGLAVGFGAQTLVKDLITGFFLIVEDIVAVGDIARIGDSGGQVEEMTLRTIRLRDFDGTLHVYPYSEAQVIHNLTKTFSFYVFDLQVSYDSDLDKAMQVMKETGEGLQNDPEYAGAILEPLEVVGVDSLGDSGVVLKARVKTLPIQQWRVGREYNRRIKLAFDAAGIEIPYPHMRLVMPPARGRMTTEAFV